MQKTFTVNSELEKQELKPVKREFVVEGKKTQKTSSPSNLKPTPNSTCKATPTKASNTKHFQ